MQGLKTAASGVVTTRQQARCTMIACGLEPPGRSDCLRSSHDRATTSCWQGRGNLTALRSLLAYC